MDGGVVDGGVEVVDGGMVNGGVEVVDGGVGDEEFGTVESDVRDSGSVVLEGSMGVAEVSGLSESAISVPGSVIGGTVLSELLPQLAASSPMATNRLVKRMRFFEMGSVI